MKCDQSLRFRTIMFGNEPAINQHPRNGWEISWNPDDNRWYVHHPVTSETMTHCNAMRNAVRWANQHDVKDF